AYVWDADGEKPPVLCKGHQTSVAQVAFSHRGDLLASTGSDGTTRLWDPGTGRQLLSAEGTGTHFSRDDRWLGLGAEGPYVGRWRVAAGSECRRLRGHDPKGDIRCLDIGLDGELLLSAGHDGVM